MARSTAVLALAAFWLAVAHLSVVSAQFYKVHAATTFPHAAEEKAPPTSLITICI